MLLGRIGLIKAISQERIAELFVEQNVDVAVPQIMEETVVDLTEQIMGVPVPQVAEQVTSHAGQSCAGVSAGGLDRGSLPFPHVAEQFVASVDAVPDLPVFLKKPLRCQVWFFVCKILTGFVNRSWQVADQFVARFAERTLAELGHLALKENVELASSVRHEQISEIFCEQSVGRWHV